MSQKRRICLEWKMLALENWKIVLSIRLFITSTIHFFSFMLINLCKMSTDFYFREVIMCIIYMCRGPHANSEKLVWKKVSPVQKFIFPYKLLCFCVRLKKFSKTLKILLCSSKINLLQINSKTKIKVPEVNELKR